MLGNDWQDYIVALLKIKYKEDFIEVPDTTHGDHGIEGYTTEGIIYQCYANQSNESLYEHQRKKITDTINKLGKNRDGLLKILGSTKICRLNFIFPYYDNKEILKHASEKEKDLVRLDLPFINNTNLKIGILTDENYWRERQIYNSNKPKSIIPNHPWVQILYNNPFFDNVSIGLKEELSYFALSTWKWVIDNLPKGYDTMPLFNIEQPVNIINNFIKVFTAETLFSESEKSLVFLAAITRELVICSTIINYVQEGWELCDLEIKEDASLLRRNFEHFLIKNPRFQRKIELLKKQGSHRAASEVGFWILKRATIINRRIFVLKKDNGLLSELLFEKIFDCQKSSINIFFEKAEVLKLSSYFFKESFAFDKTEDALIESRKLIKLPGGGELQVRLLLIAGGLALAERMSFDFAYLSDALLDYFGSTDFNLNKIAKQLNDFNWVEDKGQFELNITTDHPAVDFAIRNQVEILNIHRGVFQALMTRDHNEYINFFKPYQYVTNKIKIATDKNGRQVFNIPHLSFRLSENEIKDLLIGGALYDDRLVGVREMYQNALDACRYKRARLQYLARRVEGYPEFEADDYWQGTIEFSAGEENGRTYIECFDNGVGMSAKELRESFANAGKRYTEQEEYQEEKLLWEQVTPAIEIYPNSQFGIGVFSYFLMSDEIVVRSKRFDIDGHLKDMLELTILGKGEVCRLVKIDSIPKLKNGGTIIRLYLHDDLKFSITHVIKSWVYISEFKLSVIEGKIRSEWIPNILNLRPDQGIAIPIETSKSYLFIPNSFYFNNHYASQGVLLQDGIRIKTLFNNLILNFTGKSKDKLSVDRTKQLNININADFIQQHLLVLTNKKIDYVVSDYPEISFCQISYLCEIHPELAHEFCLQLIDQDVDLNLGWYSPQISHLNLFKLNEIGVTPFDYCIIPTFDSNCQEFDTARILDQLYKKYPKEIIDARLVFLKNLIITGTNSPDTNFKSITPSDYALLKAFLKNQFDFSFKNLKFSVFAVYELAEELGCTPLETQQTLLKFEAWGLEFPVYDFGAPRPILSDYEKKILKIERSSGYFAWMTPFSDKKLFMYKSYILQLEIKEIISIVYKYSNYKNLDSEWVAEFNDHVFSKDELFVITANVDKIYEAGFRLIYNKPVDILIFAIFLNVQPIETYKIVRFVYRFMSLNFEEDEKMYKHISFFKNEKKETFFFSDGEIDDQQLISYFGHQTILNKA